MDQVDQVQLTQGKSNYRLTSSSIVLFDSVQDFVKNAAKIIWISDVRRRLPHLVFIPGVTSKDIEGAITNGFAIDQVDFLIINEVEELDELVASFMFTIHKCRSNQLQVINRFSKNTKTWATSNFYPNKYKNFYKCKLPGLIDDNYHFIPDGDVDEELRLGNDDVLLLDMAKFYNFTYQVVLPDQLTKEHPH